MRKVDPSAQRADLGREHVSAEEGVPQPPAASVVGKPGHLEGRPDRVVEDELLPVLQFVLHGEGADLLASQLCHRDAARRHVGSSDVHRLVQVGRVRHVAVGVEIAPPDAQRLLESHRLSSRHASRSPA
ncbi:MAG TPA: hypothetical protein VNS55_04350 [Nocardioides sp.]|nr:hypothetical protein [Nocardioides sp.]